MIDFILSGTLTLRNFSDDVAVSRATGMDTSGGQAQQEVIPAGTEFTLGPGDSFAWPPFVAGELRNDGPEPVVYQVIAIIPEPTGTPEVGTMAATPPA